MNVVATELSVEQVETELAGDLMVRPIKLPRKSVAKNFITTNTSANKSD